MPLENAAFFDSRIKMSIIKGKFRKMVILIKRFCLCNIWGRGMVEVYSKNAKQR